jgi:restriction system protein
MARGFLSSMVALSRQIERDRKAAERNAKANYAISRADQVNDLNVNLNAQIAELENILSSGLSAQKPAPPWLSSDANGADETSQPTLQSLLPKRGLFRRLLPGAKKLWLLESEAVEAEYRSNEAKIAADEKVRRTEIQRFRAAYLEANSGAVCALVELALAKSSYPDGFHDQIRTAFDPASRQIIIDFRIPTLDEVVPTADKYKYSKSSDQISETKRSEIGRRDLYSRIVAQTALRTIYEVFFADHEGKIDVIILNAHVETIDPATGRDIRPCLISVRTTRKQFSELELARVQPLACLKQLKAEVSRSPAELHAVRPLADFNMMDPRFVTESDVLSTLDQRPNLMKLSPGEFENLITNLFQAMGLETKLTQASRDGGVDCVAFDQRPVLGGKVIIQAKRYKNTVGVSAVRDLFGTVHNEGASKGILVTTSGYGSASFDFAKGKPIELLSGNNLLFLLKEHAGIDARIIMPDDWIDGML